MLWLLSNFYSQVLREFKRQSFPTFPKIFWWLLGYKDLINVLVLGFEVGFEVITPKVPQKLKGLAKFYFLIKNQNDEVERFKGEDFTIVGRHI